MEQLDYVCQCKLCVRHRKWKEILDRNDLQEIKDLVNEIISLLLNSELDNNYYECILDGSWPQAKEILERALTKCPK
jgi:hypothetical protein